MELVSYKGVTLTTDKILEMHWQVIGNLLNLINKLDARVEALEAAVSSKSISRPDSKQFRTHELLEMLGISLSTFKRRVKSGAIVRTGSGLYSLNLAFGATIPDPAGSAKPKKQPRKPITPIPSAEDLPGKVSSEQLFEGVKYRSKRSKG